MQYEAKGHAKLLAELGHQSLNEEDGCGKAEKAILPDRCKDLR